MTTSLILIAIAISFALIGQLNKQAAHLSDLIKRAGNASYGQVETKHEILRDRLNDIEKSFVPVSMTVNGIQKVLYGFIKKYDERTAANDLSRENWLKSIEETRGHMEDMAATVKDYYTSRGDDEKLVLDAFINSLNETKAAMDEVKTVLESNASAMEGAYEVMTDSRQVMEKSTRQLSVLRNMLEVTKTTKGK